MLVLRKSWSLVPPCSESWGCNKIWSLPHGLEGVHAGLRVKDVEQPRTDFWARAAPDKALPRYCDADS
jgi:hypothetical protein